MRDDVDVRVPDGTQDPRRQLSARLAPTDVQRGDDEVERGQELVGEVEMTIRADLELTAMQKTESLPGCARRGDAGGLLARVPLVQLRDVPSLGCHPFL